MVRPDGPFANRPNWLPFIPALTPQTAQFGNGHCCGGIAWVRWWRCGEVNAGKSVRSASDSGVINRADRRAENSLNPPGAWLYQFPTVPSIGLEPRASWARGLSLFPPGPHIPFTCFRTAGGCTPYTKRSVRGWHAPQRVVRPLM